MEWFLIPVSMLLKNFSYTLPTVLSTFPIYILAGLFIYRLISDSNSLEVLEVDRRVMTMTLSVLLSQLVMIVYSYQITTRPQDTSGMATGPINLFAYFANIFLVYYLLVLVLRGTKQIRNFIKATMITFLVFSILVLLPQIFATRFWNLDHYVNLIGHLFEATHKGRTDFYQFGSYTTTLRRVNGFSQEASFLAAQIGIVFIPFLLAAIKNKVDYFHDQMTKRSLAFYWGLLIFAFITLFFAKTSTGFVVIGVAVIAFIVSLPAGQRKNYYYGIGIALLILLILYFVNPSISELLNKYIFKKQGTSNRLGGTLALFLTFLHYPLFGVGRGYTSFYNFEFVPKALTHNEEFFRVFQQTGFSNQSMWGEVLAGYGLIGIVPVVIFVYHKIKKGRQLQNVLQHELTPTTRLYISIIDSFYYTLTIFAVVMLFSLSWTDNIYLVVFFFYIVVINYLDKELLR
ncbi:O-antigen ligase family protein [Loigolactobacillus zhaoyuanensis]|uniref:O-antigen ligase family protein n=1 Tax=Loigolactobacillus zhaoyuanensis TaxID=2486017 RepID=UPI000F73A6EE|nr:O-antigen ligase family protein [Loigolactobacillus zhaoyuanensis]